MPLHHFTVAQGFDGITVMFCSQCGLSFSLSYNKATKTSAWEAVEFYDAKGKRMEPPGSCAVQESPSKP